MSVHQRSLFPDAYEVQDEALDALEDLQVERARLLVERARERDAGLVGLDMLDRALVWLASVCNAGQCDVELAARAWNALPAGWSRGELSSDSATFVDGVLARYLTKHAAAGAPFVDRAERVHFGALQVALAHPGPAREGLLETLASGRGARADLWGYLGDACFLAERLDEANACYVRALVLSAREVDLLRLREPRLAELSRRLAAIHAESVARELLLSEAWIEGVLAIPPDNGWIEPDRVHALLAAVGDPGAAPERRLRRFALLVYLDRSRLSGEARIEERAEMQELDPELFRRYIDVCRTRERTGTRALPW